MMDTNPTPEPEPQPTEKEGESPKRKRPPANSLTMEAERLKELMKKLGIDEPEQDKP
jgi:hypothetical protein